MKENMIHFKINNRVKMQCKRISVHSHVRDLLIIPGIMVAVLIGYSIPWSSAGTFTANTLQLLIFSGTGSG